MEALRQFLDTALSTFTYLLVDPAARTAAIIDPVDTHLDEYLDVIAREELTLAFVVETHAHADHVTSAGRLCQSTGAKTAAPVHCAILPADIQLEDGAEIRFGGEPHPCDSHSGPYGGLDVVPLARSSLRRRHAAHRGCGRTDFQDGDAGTLYDSITQKLFTLPSGTIVCPAHDCHGSTSTIGEEQRTNLCLAGKSRADCILTMKALLLPKPEAIDLTVAANRRLGLDVRQL